MADHQSPEVAGGEGFTFEGDTAAFYLTALLAEAYAPGIDDRIVVRVSVQQRAFGEPLDDVVADFEDAAGERARLSLQVKRSLTISDAKANAEFREIIRDSWATLKKPDFRINIDRYGAAVGTVAAAKERALKTLCDWARESLNTDHFDARFGATGIANADLAAVKNDVAALLTEAKGAPCTNQELHQLLAHFVLIRFDFLREGSTEPADAINRIRDCLTPEDAARAPLVWSRAVQLARASAGKSGQFDRARLVRSISSVARLRGATSFRIDLAKLTELASSYANLIPDDIGGTRLDRTQLLEDLDTKLAAARVLQIRGLPGSGKSALLRRAVQRALGHGPVLFLKAEQLEGTSWISHAAAQGLSSSPLTQLLVEVGAVGTPVLFVDAIDRVAIEHQPVILDVMRAIAESPLLDNWRVIISLRDTGIELLRNWIGQLLDILSVSTLSVGQLSDQEAEALATAQPKLRPLLFGPAHVQAIVRRPFFAKVLNQGYLASPGASTFTPRSEVDLVENWWQRGGYNETGQNAIERQRALLSLARIYARQLSQPIRLSQLTALDHIDDLRTDGILQDVRKGISVRFSHDIFFEWAFFHVLADRGTEWTEEIKACGEPPAVARVLELLSQWEYAHGQDWLTYLTQPDSSSLRSQWLRTWLIGPLGIARFETDESQFATAVSADDFRLLRKTLVWFQAEKTIPNPNILAGTLPQEQRERIADLLGWPSDFAEWRRLINFILRRISDIPPKLYPEIVTIFEVWQNALAALPNPTSRALLQQCASWLTAIDQDDIPDRPNDDDEFGEQVSDLSAFRKSLIQLLLRSSRVEPALAEQLVQRVTNSDRIRDNDFGDIIAYTPILSQSIPQSVVHLSLAFLQEELPDDRAAREDQERRNEEEWRRTILAKPKAERSRLEQMALSSGPYINTLGSYHDWDRLSLHNDHQNFWPPSPLREPFHSLFSSSPDEALRLLREICNHAMTAWRQMHRYSHNRDQNPIPLELTFPWGSQRFWGTDREYLWFRSTWAPHAIGCGFMALEEWCFAELGKGRPVDELIRKIVEGNECIAILGIAAMLALHTETVSETTLPLATSQRLLAADHNRMVQDLSPPASLIGFTQPSDKAHIEAIQSAVSRPVRKKQLRFLVPNFIFASGTISDRARESIRSLSNNLPYQYEEHRELPEVQEYLTAQAGEYAELADPMNYQAYRVEADPDRVAIVHRSPSATSPDAVAQAEEARRRLRPTGIWTWASKCFEEKKLNDTYTIETAIALAREADTTDLFERPNSENEDELLDLRRGGVAAAAAITLNFRDSCTQQDLEWAREVLRRAIRTPERRDLMWSPGAIIPWHPAIYVARGLAADLREGTAPNDAVRVLLGLIAHSLETVSLIALEEALKLCSTDLKLTWAALTLALSLCCFPRRRPDQMGHFGEALHSSREVQEAIDAAFRFYETESEWTPLPLPPPPWVARVQPTENQCTAQTDDDADGLIDTAETWEEPDVLWHSKQAGEILKRIPFHEILASSARPALLTFLYGALEWTNQKNVPPWARRGRRERPPNETFEWTRTLGGTLGLVAGLLPLRDFQTCFLDPILQLEDDPCWALLSPFASTYVCAYLYDTPTVPADTVSTVELCLERFLKAPAFARNGYRSGEFFGFDQPNLVRTLMFISVERADLAARYVNGDWSEINRILPLLNRFIRAGGWAASVMDPFLTLCERAKSDYPAEAFADQVLAIVGDGPTDLKGWHGTFIPARIAGLVQHFAHRDTPMTLELAQKFLRILDMLVDMGDRRSAALQLSEAFREIRIP